MTISGGSGLPQISFKFDGGAAIKVKDIRDLGGGVFEVCVTPPPGTSRIQITVSGGGQTPVSSFL